MSPSIHPPTQQTSPLAPITIDNTLKEKFSNSPTPTDKVKIGENINKVTIKLSNFTKKKKKTSQSDKVFNLKERETLISLSDFQFSDKRETETERSKRENPLEKKRESEKKSVK